MTAVKGFENKKTITEIVDDTLLVHSNGSVSFRTHRGKGSGKAVEISADQFDKFVRQMNDIASRRTELAEKAKGIEADNSSDEESV